MDLSALWKRIGAATQTSEWMEKNEHRVASVSMIQYRLLLFNYEKCLPSAKAKPFKCAAQSLLLIRSAVRCLARISRTNFRRTPNASVFIWLFVVGHVFFSSLLASIPDSSRQHIILFLFLFNSINWLSSEVRWGIYARRQMAAAVCRPPKHKILLLHNFQYQEFDLISAFAKSA